MYSEALLVRLTIYCPIPHLRTPPQNFFLSKNNASEIYLSDEIREALKRIEYSIKQQLVYVPLLYGAFESDQTHGCNKPY